MRSGSARPRRDADDLDSLRGSAKDRGLAGRLASTDRGALRGGPRDGRTDPAIAVRHWRAVREQLYREHPHSPVPPDARATFRAAHFEHDPSLRFEAVVEPAPPPPPFASAPELPTSGTDTDVLAFTRIGRIAIRFADGVRSLSVFWMTGCAGGLFTPFRDATNGTETYGAGRHLLDGRRARTWAATPRAARSPSTSTSQTNRRAPSTRAGRVRSRPRRTASTL